MSERVYQILYCSRNRMQGTTEEIDAQVEVILRKSRSNNAGAGVTGALFFNTVFFAQVLEGSFVDVQRTFERLQLDARHGDLVVLQSGFIAARNFSEWSMAYAGTTADLMLPGHPTLPRATAVTPDAEEVSAFLRGVVVQEESWALPSRVSFAV